MISWLHVLLDHFEGPRIHEYISWQILTAYLNIDEIADKLQRCSKMMHRQEDLTDAACFVQRTKHHSFLVKSLILMLEIRYLLLISNILEPLRTYTMDASASVMKVFDIVNDQFW